MITTNRLTLKPYTSEDVDGLINLLINPEITKTFMVPEYESHEQMEALSKKLIDFSQVEDTKHFEFRSFLIQKPGKPTMQREIT